MEGARPAAKSSGRGSPKKTQRQPKSNAKAGSTAQSSSQRARSGTSEPKVQGTTKAAWAPDTKRAPKPPTAPLDRATDAPPLIPNWDEVEGSTARSDPRLERPGENGLGDARLHGPLAHHRRRRSRVFIASVVLLCLLFAFIAVAAILSERNNNNTTGTANPPAASTPAVSPAAASRLLAETKAVDAATVTARSTLRAIKGFPTPANVGAVINPYILSLLHYETLLTGTIVPDERLQGLRTLVGQDAQFLGTIKGLPSLDLGAYLAEVSRRSTQLQTALAQAQQKLQTATR